MSLMLLGLCIVLENGLFSSFLLGTFKVNYAVNLEGVFFNVFSANVHVP